MAVQVLALFGTRILYSNYRQWGFLPHIGIFFRVSLISLCLKTFRARGVTRSKPILGGLIYFYRLEIANKHNGVYLVYLRLSN